MVVTCLQERLGVGPGVFSLDLRKNDRGGEAGTSKSHLSCKSRSGETKKYIKESGVETEAACKRHMSSIREKKSY